MSKRTAAEIAAKLIEHGADAAMPMVLAQNLGRDDEIVIAATLESVEDCVQQFCGTGPVITATGQVFARVIQVESAQPSGKIVGGIC